MGDQDPEQRPECESVLAHYHKWAVDKHHVNKYSTIVLENLKKEQDDFLYNFVSKKRVLVDNGLNDRNAKTVVMIEMIIDCLSSMRSVGPPEERPAIDIEKEIEINVYTQLWNSLKVFVDKYGKNVLNLVDDSLEISSESIK